MNNSKNGYISYCKDPLLYQDNHLKMTRDYDIVIQGHVHFNSEVLDAQTTFYTLRAVGMGYDAERKKSSILYNF